MPLFWLNYRDHDGQAAGVVVVEAEALVAARLKAALAGLDAGLEFVTGNQLDEASSQQIPAEMIGRLLGDRDLLQLKRAVTPRKRRGVSKR